MTPFQNDSYRLLQTLQIAFAAQAREVMHKLPLDVAVDDELPDMTHWVAALAKVTQPVMLQQFQQGILVSRRRLAALRGNRNPKSDALRSHVLASSDIFKGVMLYGRVPFRRAYATSFSSGFNSWNLSDVVKARRVAAPYAPITKASGNLSMNWDLFNPKVLDAVDAATMKFCRETNRTATTDLKVAIAKLRKLLKQGLKRGDAVQLLSRQIRHIFADPMRAFRIAVTEVSRAQHAGQLFNAQEDPDVKGKEWLASSDACDSGLGPRGEGCIGLNGVIKKLDKPFWVDPGGGPYAVIMHPPLHPHCFCTMMETI